MAAPQQLSTLARESLADRPLAVLGIGRSGRGALALAARLGVPAQAYDERYGTKFTLESAQQHRLVVCSPGFPSNHPWLRLARDMGASIWTEFDWAATHCTGRMIAVTGTNGKSSLSHLLTAAFANAGQPVVEAGNSGIPLSEILAEQGSLTTATTVVAEISSFQAELLCVVRPRALLWTTFAPDHLDRHASLGDYFLAKRRLIERLAADGWAWAGPSVAAASAQLDLPLGERVRIVSPEGNLPESFGLGAPAIGWYLAQAFWEHEGLPRDALERAAASFHPLPHRLNFIRELDGVRYYNDSKATNFEAAIAAVKSVPGPLHWIGGGRGKGEDPEALISAIAPYVTQAYLIGETAPELFQACRSQHIAACCCMDLPQAIERATALARRSGRGSVLLSPGMGSQDQFKDFADRGNIFSQTVFRLPESGLPATLLAR